MEAEDNYGTWWAFLRNMLHNGLVAGVRYRLVGYRLDTILRSAGRNVTHLGVKLG